MTNIADDNTLQELMDDYFISREIIDSENYSGAKIVRRIVKTNPWTTEGSGPIGADSVVMWI